MKLTYLDNAATTPLDNDVAKTIQDAHEKYFGNPSSIHALGRKSKAVIEQARKNIAGFIGASGNEIIFTSGATEANNFVFHIAKQIGIERIITSPTEHYAVLEPAKKCEITLDYVNILSDGTPDLDHLNSLLSNTSKKTLVSLMFVNNETGNMTNIGKVAQICHEQNALIHTDAVQGIGYFDINVSSLNIDFLSCSAHKFHGPKGIGFLYCKENYEIAPFIKGGSQEKGYRAGTENISGILGLEHALEKTKKLQEENVKYLNELNNYLLELLNKSGLAYSFNSNLRNCSPAIKNISFSTKKDVSMLLFNFDLAGVCLSGGSACTSGSNKGSHVLSAMKVSMDEPAVRISFSKFTSKEDISHFVNTVTSLLS